MVTEAALVEIAKILKPSGEFYCQEKSRNAEELQSLLKLNGFVNTNVVRLLLRGINILCNCPDRHTVFHSFFYCTT